MVIPLLRKASSFSRRQDQIGLKNDRFKHRFIRFEADERPLFLRLLPGIDEVPLRNAGKHFPRLLIRIGAEFHFMNGLVIDLYPEPFGKRVRHRSAHAVQPPRIIVIMRVEFSARVQLRKYDFHRGDAHFGMDIRGNAAAVVLHRGGTVGIQFDVNAVGVAVCRLVDRIIHDLPKDMVKPAASGGPDVHAGPHADRVQPLENLDILCLIRRSFICLCHAGSSPIRRNMPNFNLLF